MPSIGLSSEEALLRLRKLLQQGNAASVESSTSDRLRWWWIALVTNSDAASPFQFRMHTPLCFLISLLASVGSITSSLTSTSSAWTMLLGCVVCLITLFNCCLCVAITHLRHSGLRNRLISLCDTINALSTSASSQWTERHYPPQHVNVSGTISLQTTYRDNCAVQLPVCLLVPGDIIEMRPGREVPADCRAVDGEEQLRCGDTYCPRTECLKPAVGALRSNNKIPARLFEVSLAPFLLQLEALKKRSQVHNGSPLHDESKTVARISCLLSLLILLLSLLVVLLRVLLLRSTDWSWHLLVWPAYVIFPLLPLLFPGLWLLLNLYHLSVVSLPFKQIVANAAKGDVAEHSETSLSLSLSSLDSSATKETHFLEVMKHVLRILSRNTELDLDWITNLGALTVFSCVDRTGLLSWSLPTAEKIFFLRRKHRHSSGHANIKNRKRTEVNSRRHTLTESTVDANSLIDSATETVNSQTSYHVMRAAKRISTDTELNSQVFQQSDSHAQVLDLSHNPKQPYTLSINDVNWRRYMSNLKPIGLNILLNNCHKDVREDYRQFADHVLCTSLASDIETAFVARYCLCEIPRQLGFKSSALDPFEVESTLGTYKHISGDKIFSDKVLKALSTIEQKAPMGNMFSSVVQDRSFGQQLMSQGSADLIMDVCTDYFDGSDVVPLNEMDRRRVLDFFQRHSYSSYCTAFSYAPLLDKVGENLGDVFLELPAGHHVLGATASLFKSSNVASIVYNSTGNVDNELVSERTAAATHLLHPRKSRSKVSTESLTSGLNMCVTTPEGCLHLQSNQVFLGMTAMQYQARADVVQLIDHLERACVRFVHFSSENELRSRVFAERLGIEAGWNCHISLRSESPPNTGKRLSVKLEDNVDDDGDTNFDSAAQNVSDKELLFLVNEPCSLYHCKSAPSLMQKSASELPQPRVKFCDKTTTMLPPAIDLSGVIDEEFYFASSNSSISSSSTSSNDSKGKALEDDASLLSSAGIHTSSQLSQKTDDSIGVYIDPNKSKMPRGVDQIRPHLEQVDNIPLQVSLFTDCTPLATREMLLIMRDYGEVTAVMGSILGMRAGLALIVADVALGLKPALPQICLRESSRQQRFSLSVAKSTDEKNLEFNPLLDGPAMMMLPIDLAARLHGLACHFTCNREDPVSFIRLVADSRLTVRRLRASLLLYLATTCSSSVTLLLAGLMQLPIVLLEARHLLFLMLLLPLFAALIPLGSHHDPTLLMLEPPVKRHQTASCLVIRRTIGHFAFICAPLCLVTVLCALFTASHFCASIIGNDNVDIWVWYLISHKLANNNSLMMSVELNRNVSSCYDSTVWTQIDPQLGAILQNFALSQLICYFTLIAPAFIQMHNVRFWPCNHLTWIVGSALFVIVALILSLLDSVAWRSSLASWTLIPLVTWLLGIAWLPLMIVVNTLLIYRMEKIHSREQRASRLLFGTKLGMYSPV